MKIKLETYKELPESVKEKVMMAKDAEFSPDILEKIIRLGVKLGNAAVPVLAAVFGSDAYVQPNETKLGHYLKFFMDEENSVKFIYSKYVQAENPLGCHAAFAAVMDAYMHSGGKAAAKQKLLGEFETAKNLIEEPIDLRVAKEMGIDAID